MNRKKITVLAILMIAVLVLSLGVFTACNNSGGDETEKDPVEATEGLLIPNGDFKVLGTTTEAYPRTINNWTGSKMYSSDSFSDDVISGGVNMDRDKYNANKSKWKDNDGALWELLTKGGKYTDDDIKNALMIYMPEKGTDLGDDDAEYGPTAYGYTSSSFTLDKGSYYKLSIDVFTYNIKGDGKDGNEGNAGARIYLSSNTYSEFSAIDTNGEWKTYTIYIETTPTASTALSLMLGLGKYTSTYSLGLTTGYAFFDNLTLSKIEKTDEGTMPEQIYKNAVADELTDSSFLHTTTLKVPNGHFDFGTPTLSSSSAPYNWSVVTGNNASTDKDPAPTSLGYNAIIDASKFAENYSKYSNTYNFKNADNTVISYLPANKLSNITNFGAFPYNRLGTNVYMLSQQLMTAQGLKSSKQITIEKNKTYKLSIDLYTYDVYGQGVSLILSGSEGDDIVVKGISSKSVEGAFIGGVPAGTVPGSDVEGNTNGKWTTYTFYIHGNQYRDYSYNYTVWLGTGGKNGNTAVDYQKYSSSGNASDATTYSANGTFSTGWVFMDELSLQETDSLPQTGNGIGKIENNTYDLTIDGNGSTTGFVIDLETENNFSYGNQLSNYKNADFGFDDATKGTPTNWVYNYDDSKDSAPNVTPEEVTAGIVDISSEENFGSNVGTEYPGLPYEMPIRNAYMMLAKNKSYFEILSDVFVIKQGNFYRVSLWVKTQDIKSTSGIYVSMYDNKGTTDNYDDDVVIGDSFAKINTKDYDSYTNDWCELTFLVRASGDEDTTAYLKFTLGTGDRWAADTLAQGAAFVANMCLTNISYNAYDSAKTGTYVKSVDLSESKETAFSNGQFNNYDLEDENLNENRQMSGFAGIPSNWTINDEKLNENQKDSNLVAGILKMDKGDGLSFTTSDQIKNVFKGSQFGADADGVAKTFDKLYAAGTDSSVLGSGPSVLAIGSKSASESFAAGFASDSFTLSANTIYEISLWVKTFGNTKASVFLTSESGGQTAFNQDAYFKIEKSSDSEWTNYKFYIEVGLTSVSMQLNLWLGYDTDYVNVDGDTDEEKTANASSSGLVVFDAITQHTMEQKDFDAITEATDSTRKISFMTDGFDAISSTVESRKELTSPSGWTGSADSNQKAANSNYGVIYADEDYLVTHKEDREGYVNILGGDIDRNDITYTDEELQQKLEELGYDNPTDEQKVEAAEKLIDEKYEALIVEKWMPIDELVKGTTNSNKRFLVINNKIDSAYYYTGSSLTLNANSFYKISVLVRTYKVNASTDDNQKGAYVELNLGSANESGNPFIFNALTNEGWEEYSFYVQTLDDDITSVKLKLALGKYIDEDGLSLTSGYAMFDDVTVEKVTKAIYDQAVLDSENNDSILTRQVSEKATSGETGNEGTTETPTNAFNLDYLWWMIPTILLAIITIIVIIVFAVRKIKRPKKTVLEESASQEVIDEKHDKYDDNRE